MLGTDPVLPLAIAELELLGLLGPEPGALLQREETDPEKNRKKEGGIKLIHNVCNEIIYFK